MVELPTDPTALIEVAGLSLMQRMRTPASQLATSRYGQRESYRYEATSLNGHVEKAHDRFPIYPLSDNYKIDMY